MASLSNILRGISSPCQLCPTLPLLQKISVPKLNTEILLLLRNVLRISAKDLQQYSGLMIVYKVVHDGLKMEYSESDWLKISEMFSDIVVTFFHHILNYQNSNFFNEKGFCNLVHHAAKLLIPIVDKVEYVRITVLRNGFSPILSIVCLDKMDLIIRKALFLLFKQTLVKADTRLRKTIMNNSHHILSKLAELTLVCGDFEMQESIIEILMRFSWTSKQKLRKVMLWYQRHPQILGFVEVLDYSHFDTSCREFLNMLNESLTSYTKVITLPCVEAYGNDLKLKKPNVDKFKELWVDFSLTTGVIHLLCDSGGSAWLKIYVERSNVKTILISSRDKHKLQATKQIFVEFLSPLQLRLPSSDKCLATLTLIFLEGPKFNCLEESFFQKSYNGIYKIIKTNMTGSRRKMQSPTLHSHGERFHDRKYFFDGASSISSIRTSSSCCANKSTRPECDLKRKEENSLNRDSKFPLLTSTPKPATPMLNQATCDLGQNSPSEGGEKSKLTLGILPKRNEPSKLNTSIDRSSLISYLKDSDTLETDRKFKQICEEKLEKIRLEKKHANEKQPDDKVDERGNSNSCDVAPKDFQAKEPVIMSNFNFTNDRSSLISKIRKEEVSNKHKVKEIVEDSTFQQQSEESPFILTTGRRFTSDKSSALNQVSCEKENQGQQHPEESIVQGNSESKSSNLETMKNLLLSRSLGNSMYGGKGTDKVSTPFLDISSNKISFGSKESYKNSQESLQKPVEKESTNSFSSSEDSNNSNTHSRYSSKFSSIKPGSLAGKNSNPYVFGSNPSSAVIQSNYNLQGHNNEPLSEPKTKKPKLLRSPKPNISVLSTSNSSLPQQAKIKNSNMPHTKLFDLLWNTKERTTENCIKLSDNSSNSEKSDPKSDLVSSEENRLDAIKKTNKQNKLNDNSTGNIAKNTQVPLNPQKSRASNLESLTGKENDKNTQNISSDSCFYRGSFQHSKLLSPNNSFHCRIPTKTYYGKHPHKSCAKQLTPDKIFDTLKSQKSKRELDVDAEGNIVARKRRLFNPHDVLSELIEEKTQEKENPKKYEEASSTSEASPVMLKRKAVRRNSQQNRGTKNESDQQKNKTISLISLKETFISNKCTQDVKGTVRKTRRSCRQVKKINYIEVSSDESFLEGSNDSRDNKKKETNPQRFLKNQTQTPINSNQQSENINKSSVIESKTINSKSISDKIKSNIKQNSRATLGSEELCLGELGVKKQPSEEPIQKEVVSNTKKTAMQGKVNISHLQETQANSNKSIKATNTLFRNNSPNQTPKCMSKNYLHLEQISSSPNPNNTDETPNNKKYSTIKDTRNMFTSLVEKLPSSEVLREAEAREMIQEEVAPVQGKASDSSSLELVIPPFCLSHEDSGNNIQMSDPDERHNNSSKVSTGTQADARAELDFLDNVVTNLEKMSLGPGRIKIIKEVGTLENSLKKVEMYTETSNKKLKQKCLEAKKSIETMKSNLENMLSSCDEFLQSFQTKMVDIKSTMSRLSNDVASDQDLKIKVAEDIGKMCRERKNTVRFEKFL